MTDADPPTEDLSIKARWRGLYEDQTAQAFRFRLSLVGIDIAAVLYFVISTFLPAQRNLHVVDIGIGVFFLFELLGRVWVDRRPWRLIFHPMTLLDMAVIASLLAPFFIGNLLFLRLLRTLRLFHSYSVLEELRRNSEYVRRHVEVIIAATNLVVFLFVATALVYLLQKDTNPQISNYLDALYFAVATLTTTGYGDITLVGDSGRILAIAMMVFGVSLFIRLIQAVFQSARHHKAHGNGQSPSYCPHCGADLRTGSAPDSSPRA